MSVDTAKLRGLIERAELGELHYQEQSDAYTHIVRKGEREFVVQFSQDTTGKAEARARLFAELSNLPALLDEIERLREADWEPTLRYCERQWAEERSTMMRQVHALRVAVLKCAPHHQGGHSDTGQAIADALGIPFPVSMDSLRPLATELGFMPYDLWPWFKRRDDERAALNPPKENEDGD